MIKTYFFLFFLCSFVLCENLNSIFYNANSPRVNSLGGCIFSSNDIADVLSNPLNLKYKFIPKTYFSYYTFLNRSVEIFQISHNVSNKEEYMFNVGLLGKVVKNNYDTYDAWNENSNLQYEDINYSLISTFDDREISLILSFDKKIKDFNVSTKIKPIVHFINGDKGFGISSDIFISRNIYNLNLMLALKDMYYKSWDNYSSEKYRFKFIFCTQYIRGNIFVVLNLSEYNNKIGIEYKIYNDLYVRFGYDELNKYAYGFGIQKDFLSINFSNKLFYDLSSNINQFSLAFSF